MNFNGFLGRCKATANAYGPEALIIGGAFALVSATVLAVMATPKAVGVKKQLDEDFEDIKKAHETGKAYPKNDDGVVEEVSYSESDYKSDMKIHTAHVICGLAKPYLPAVGLTVLGLTGIGVGLGKMHKREAAAISALGAVSTAFSAYRDRVVSEFGAVKDQELYTGMKAVSKKVKVKNEDGKTETVTKTSLEPLDASVGDCPLLSPYAIKITSDNCSSFKHLSGDPIYVENWLKIVESNLNRRLALNQIMYLEDILDDLDIHIDKTSSCGINSYVAHNVGWIYTDYYYDVVTKKIEKNEGDKYIDFGCFGDDPDRTLQIVRGKDGEVYLDFNVDGWINGKIPVKDNLHRILRKNPDIEK